MDVKADYQFLVDWNNDGNFSHANSDISDLVLTASWERFGRDPNGGTAATGTIRIKLDNSSRIFSSYNASSPIYGKILPNRRVKIIMTLFSVPITEAFGWLQTIIPTVGPKATASTADLFAYGSLYRLSKADIHIAMQTDQTTGYNAGLVLEAAGITSGERTVDTGLSTLGRFWANGTAAQAMAELEAAEAGLLHETKDGKIQLEGRSHRLNAPHNAAVSTYGAGTLNIWSLKQEDHLKSIYNLVEASARTFNKTDDQVLVTVCDVKNGLGGPPPSIPAGQSLTITMAYPDPNGNSQYPAVSEWGVIDCWANSQEDGTGTDLSSLITPSRVEYADRVEATFANGAGSTVYLVLLRAHGTAVAEGNPIPVKSEDGPPSDPDTSQGKYGIRRYPNPSQWLTRIDEAQAYTDHILALTKDPNPWLTWELRANYDWTHLEEAQRIDISDRIHVHAGLDFGLMIDEDFFVEKLVHKVDEARLHTVEITAQACRTHSWPASGTPYEPKIIPTNETGAPDDLEFFGIANGLTCYAGSIPWKWNAGTFLAEFRAKFFPIEGPTPPKYVDLRTVEEGGTLAHNGADEIVLTDLTADQGGLAVTLEPADSPPGMGRWYCAFRFQNLKGWSVWTDGNDVPQYVTDEWIDTIDPALTDSGPPQTWTVGVREATPGWAVAFATRPEINGNCIWFAGFQIKDGRTGAWYDVNANTGAAQNFYDGSAIPHAVELNGKKIRRLSGTGFGTASIGDLLIMDMRGAGNFAIEHVKWATITNFDGKRPGDPGYDPASATFIMIDQGQLTPADTTDVRIMIVSEPWGWATDGYLGGSTGHGYVQMEYWQIGGDRTTTLFESKPIPLPAGTSIADLEARVWFENAYSRNDDDTYSSALPEESPPGPGSSGYEIILPDAAVIQTDARLSDTIPRKIYFVQLLDSVGPTREIGNPTGAKHRQPFAYILRQSAAGGLAYTLGSKFRMTALVNTGSSNLEGSHQDYLGVMYDGYDDAFDVVSFVPNYGD